MLFLYILFEVPHSFESDSRNGFRFYFHVFLFIVAMKITNTRLKKYINLQSKTNTWRDFYKILGMVREKEDPDRAARLDAVS